MDYSGVIIVNKGEGITSQGVVSAVKRIFGVAKAGHTGTLDPMATGVLPVLVGRGVKASEFMLSSDKHYVATLLLGVTTDTEDVTGRILTECDEIPDPDRVLDCISNVVGPIMQIPPVYSALEIGGRKLCDLARDGVTVEREARPVTVYSIDPTPVSDREYTLDIKCSKGTYIRTLCADIGAALGCGGVMKTLCRASASGFTLASAHTLDELREMSDGQRAEQVLSVESIFQTAPVEVLPEFFARLAHSGLEIYLSKIGRAYAVGERIRLYDGDGFFALGEVREYPDGAAIKPIRQFRL